MSGCNPCPSPAWPDAWIGLAQTHAELGEHELALTYVDAGLSKPYPQTGLILIHPFGRAIQFGMHFAFFGFRAFQAFIQFLLVA